MNHRPSLLLCALALAGCNNPTGGEGPTSSSSSSGEPAETGPMTTGAEAPTTSGATTFEVTSGTGSSGHVPGTTTSSGGETTEEPSTGVVASTGTTGSTGSTGSMDAEPAPDWALMDVNPNSATYEQTRSRSDYAGSVSGWYFAHAT